MRELKGATVVITGASSGIGRAAAQCFAREGANVVVSARRASVLEEVVAECERLATTKGGGVLAVAADVADAGAMKALAEQAVARFGHVDVWISNAGVGVVGDFPAAPIETHEQVVRTNLLGVMNGAHAILPHFRQRRQGVLIHTNSLGAWVPAPYAASYSASKFGIRGFSEALRGELGAWPGIQVCEVYPGFVDTPGIAHAANHVGRALSVPPPVLSPFEVAETMVALARRPRPGVMVGAAAWASRLGYAVAPGAVRWGMGRFMERYFRQAERVPVTDGALFAAPTRQPGVYGGWRRQRLGRSPVKTGALVLGGAALALWLARRSTRA
ncbi:SDR family oxidoreductase [Roseomonas elaeocarpi]|uniref:SDR family oxidoreductase n=1 Tax=Roseomonas elaeocarpi TaxID=907779 RepID=A0ABV6JSX0_9PROT